MATMANDAEVRAHSHQAFWETLRARERVSDERIRRQQEAQEKRDRLVVAGIVLSVVAYFFAILLLATFASFLGPWAVFLPFIVVAPCVAWIMCRFGV